MSTISPHREPSRRTPFPLLIGACVALALAGCHRAGAERSTLPPSTTQTSGALVEPASPAPFDGPPQRIFQNGEGGYAMYRIPALVATPKGTLLAFAEARRNGPADIGDIDLVVRRSEDGGRSWGAVQVLWDDGINTAGNPAPVVDARSGVITLLASWNAGDHPTRHFRAGFGTDSRRVFVLRSTDDGLTFSAPVEITSEVKHEDWNWYATGPGHGIQLTHAPHAGRLVVCCNHNIEGNLPGSHLLLSEDGGVTWRVGGSTYGDNDLRPNECMVSEWSDGSLYVSMRNQGETRFRLRAFSTDGGATLTAPEVDTSLVSPKVQGSVLTLFDAAKGRAALLHVHPATTNRRRNLLLKVSHDGGRTWARSVMLWRAPASYSDMAVLSDGSVGLLYEGGNHDSNEAIYFGRLRTW